MVEAPKISLNLNDQKQFRLTKTNEVKDYFITEIKERGQMSKRISKYIALFEYFDKSLIVLSATSSSISIASFATVIGASVGVTSASCSLEFSMSIRIQRKLLKTTRNKKKKHNKIVMLGRNKLNSIESKLFKVLINNEIGHEGFMTIIN